LHLALWFQVIGFFESSLLLILVKWKEARLFIAGFREKYTKNNYISSAVWIVAHLFANVRPIRWKIKKYGPVLVFILILAQLTKSFVINPILIVILVILGFPAYVLSSLSMFFFSKNKLTNILIIVGTCMVLIGLSLELWMSY